MKSLFNHQHVEIDLPLTHDGMNWVVTCDGRAVSGPTLGVIDESLPALIRHDRNHLQGNIKVTMRFDMDTLPRWLHQYSSHYFNRTVTISMPGSAHK